MGFIPWDSQPLEAWAKRHAAGTFIDLAGHTAHYVMRGQGEPVILLHGFFYDMSYWQPNLQALANHFTVYALDLWGFGYSSREPMDYGYALYAEQVRLFMEALGLQRVALVGHSFGAGAAIRFAIEQPTRVDKLVLAAPAALPNPPPWASRLFSLPGIGEWLVSLSTDRLRQQLLKQFWFYRRDLVTPEYVQAVTQFHKVQGTRRAALSVLRRRFFDTLTEDVLHLGRLDVPVLIIWGRQDCSIPVGHAEQFHRLLPRARVELLDAAGHAVNVEQADTFNRLALEFLQAREPFRNPLHTLR